MTFSVRKFKAGEEGTLWQLFHDTIHHVNCRDYDIVQLQAWAPDDIEMSDWVEKVQRINPWVCLSGDKIVGYTDLQPDGLIDHFFVHHGWQRKGVGRKLFETIDKTAEDLGLEKLYAHVSITARPFFESRGFEVVQQQEVAIGEVVLTNVRMQKLLPNRAT